MGKVLDCNIKAFTAVKVIELIISGLEIEEDIEETAWSQLFANVKLILQICLSV